MKWNWFDMIGVENDGFSYRTQCQTYATIARLRQDQRSLVVRPNLLYL
jgi:hypothetical protein